MNTVLSIGNNVAEIIENLNNIKNLENPLIKNLILLVLIVIIILLFLIIMIKGLIAASKFAKEVGYSMISMNIIFAAVPFLLVTAPAFFQFEPSPKAILYISMIACWGIVLVSNIFGCRFHVGYILFYTVVQLLLGFIAGIFGIAGVAFLVIFIFVGGAITYQRAETYNIVLYPCNAFGGMMYFWDTENIIRARQNPNNSNELLGSEGEVLRYAGNGYYQLMYETREYEYYKPD